MKPAGAVQPFLSGLASTMVTSKADNSESGFAVHLKSLHLISGSCRYLALLGLSESMSQYIYKTKETDVPDAEINDLATC